MVSIKNIGLRAFALTAFASALLGGSSAMGVLAPVPVGTTQAAGILVPADNLTTILDPTPAGPGSIQMSVVLGTVASNTGSFTMTAREIVFRNDAGTLDFLFQIENIAGSSDSIKRATISGFGNFTTSVDAEIRAGAIVAGDSVFGGFAGQTFGLTPPQTADRQSANTVGFEFTGTAFDIDPGTTSKWFVIRTNATNFVRTGSLQTIDGGVAFVSAFVPVPEPTTALFGVALGVVSLGRFMGRNRVMGTATA